MGDLEAPQEGKVAEIKKRLEGIMKRVLFFRESKFKKLPMSILDDLDFMILVVQVLSDANAELVEELSKGASSGLVNLAGEPLKAAPEIVIAGR